MAGVTYMEIMQEGGGIAFTVKQTKLATDEELMASLVARLKRMLCAGKNQRIERFSLLMIRYNVCGMQDRLWFGMA